VLFVENSCQTISGSSHYSLSSQLPYPLYLSFECEQTEETFDIPIRLDLNNDGGSNAEHLWIIYISRPHCHFVTTGAMITFKAHPSLEMKQWGLRVVLEHEIYIPSSSSTNEVHFLDSSSTNEVNRLDYVHESSSSRPEIQLPYNWYEDEEKSKFQLRYNWHVTEEEEYDSNTRVTRVV
jgi:hypothetical protein